MWVAGYPLGGNRQRSGDFRQRLAADRRRAQGLVRTALVRSVHATCPRFVRVTDLKPRYLIVARLWVLSMPAVLAGVNM